MDTRKRRGAPPKPQSVKLSRVINFRVTEEIGDTLDRLAMKMRVSTREYLQGLIQRSLSGGYKP